MGRAWFVALTCVVGATVVVAGCQGGDGGGGARPCAASADCDDGQRCVEGRCASPEGAPAAGGDGPEAGGAATQDGGAVASGPRPGCYGLYCQQVTCSDGSLTTVTGTVLTPRG